MPTLFWCPPPYMCRCHALFSSSRCLEKEYNIPTGSKTSDQILAAIAKEGLSREQSWLPWYTWINSPSAADSFEHSSYDEHDAIGAEFGQ